MTTALCYWVNTLRVSNLCRTVVKTAPTQYLLKKVLGCTSLCFAFVLCEEHATPMKFQVDGLSHEQCIKQACLLSVNSASSLLMTTSVALLDICKTYKDSLNRILALLEEVQTLKGNDSPELWDAIVEARTSVNRAKESLSQLNSYMETVEKVVNATTEAAFLAGAEYMCTALCERLNLAQKEIQKNIVDLKGLEEDYLRLQKEITLSKENDSKNKVKDKSTFNFLKLDAKDLLN